MEIRFFRFFAKGWHGKRAQISYGFGDIDDAIRHCHKLEDEFAHSDRFAGYAFEFESVDPNDPVMLVEGFEIECALLCSIELYRDFVDMQAMQAA